jgi:hypothetical protein
MEESNLVKSTRFYVYTIMSTPARRKKKTNTSTETHDEQIGLGKIKKTPHHVQLKQAWGEDFPC